MHKVAIGCRFVFCYLALEQTGEYSMSGTQKQSVFSALVGCLALGAVHLLLTRKYAKPDELVNAA